MCIRDNKTADGTPITGPDIKLDIDTIGNGMTLGENCTTCHRGDNVFNIHPGTALDLSRPNAPGGPYVTDIFDPNGTGIRYTPIGQPHWSLSLIHISEPTRLLSISYAVFCLKKKKKI